MPLNASKDSILTSCIKGTKKAWKSYYKSSSGSWLWNTHECFITVNIFEELSKLNLLLEMESNIKKNIEIANIQYPGRYPKYLNLKGKFDIAVLWKDESFRGIIEVKMMRNNGLTEIEKDIKEIVSFLKLAKDKDSRAQFGIIVVYTDYYDENGKAKETVKRRLQNVIDRCNKVNEELNFNTQKLLEIKNVPDEDSSWGVVACMFSITK